MTFLEVHGNGGGVKHHCWEGREHKHLKCNVCIWSSGSFESQLGSDDISRYNSVTCETALSDSACDVVQKRFSYLRTTG
jgi:hypothetical protein